jgi:hypothetical protein
LLIWRGLNRFATGCSQLDKMPPRSSLTSSFSITDANNEVVCPLRNQDGSSCRKRCIGVSVCACPVTAVLLSPPAICIETASRSASRYRNKIECLHTMLMRHNF